MDIEICRFPEPQFYIYEPEQPSPSTGAFGAFLTETAPRIGPPRRTAVVADFHVKMVNHGRDMERVLECHVIRKGRRKPLWRRYRSTSVFTQMYYPANGSQPVKSIEVQSTDETKFRVRATEFGAGGYASFMLSKEVVLQLELEMAGSLRRITRPLYEMRLPFI